MQLDGLAGALAVGEQVGQSILSIGHDWHPYPTHSSLSDIVSPLPDGVIEYGLYHPHPSSDAPARNVTCEECCVCGHSSTRITATVIYALLIKNKLCLAVA